MTISPEALEKARAIDWTRIDDALISCAGLLKTLCRDNIGDTAASELEYARSVIAALQAAPKLPDDLAALPGEPVAWIGPQSWETLQRDGRVQTEIAKDEFMGPRRKRWVALYASPLPVRPITDEDVKRAAKAVSDEWGKMVAEMSPHMSPGDIARSFVSPGNHRLIRAALEAAGGRG